MTTRQDRGVLAYLAAERIVSDHQRYLDQPMPTNDDTPTVGHEAGPLTGDDTVRMKVDAYRKSCEGGHSEIVVYDDYKSARIYHHSELVTAWLLGVLCGILAVGACAVAWLMVLR